MVPFQLPTLPWCDAATFTPNARCADLHRKPTFKKESNQGLFPVSMTDFVLIKNKLISYPGFPLLVLFGIAGSKAGGMITVLASFTLQQWLRKRRSSMITWSKTKLTWPGNSQTVPWSVCFFCRTRDKTCSGGNTSSPCSRRKVAPPAQDKTDGKAHSTLGKTASAKSQNDKERFHFHCPHSLIDVSWVHQKLLPHVDLYWHKGSKHRVAWAGQRSICLSHPYSRHSPECSPPGIKHMAQALKHH